jgi:hypothetical protein
MKYYCILINDKPYYVVPDGYFPAGHGDTKMYISSVAADMQQRLDAEDGVTTAWKRKRHTLVYVCDGYELPKLVNGADVIAVTDPSMRANGCANCDD